MVYSMQDLGPSGCPSAISLLPRPRVALPSRPGMPWEQAPAPAEQGAASTGKPAAARHSVLSQLVSVPGFPGDDEQELCPELVVPGTCECILVMPARPLSPESGAVDITDMSGDVALRVAVHKRMGNSPSSSREVPFGSGFQGGTGGPGTSPRPVAALHLVLQTAQGEPLAQCRTCLPEIQVLRNNGEHFAKFMLGHGRDEYTLVSPGGARLKFWGSIERHNISVTDSEGKLVATTEPCAVDFDPGGKYFRVRVAPCADVGLMVLSLLCIQCFDLKG